MTDIQRVKKVVDWPDNLDEPVFEQQHFYGGDDFEEPLSPR